jgi:hypothetical protein
MTQDTSRVLKNTASFVGRGFTACGKSQSRASGVKTPDEKACFMSELKLRPPKIRPFFCILFSHDMTAAQFMGL